MTELIKTLAESDFIFAVLRVSTPLILAGMAAVVAASSGAVNIALDGLMLISAFAAAMTCGSFGSGIGLVFAVLSGVLGGALLALFTQYMKCHMIIAGLAMNFIASGGTAALLFAMTGSRGDSMAVAGKVLPCIELAFVEGGAFDWLSGHNIVTYMAVLIVPLTWLLLKKTGLGLLLRAAGESPEAVEAVGGDVRRLRTVALMISGGMCGLAGGFLSMGYLSWFACDMTAGRGWLSLCAQAMGGGSFGTAVAALLFGTAEAFANVAGVLGLPYELARTLPYLVTLAVFFCGMFMKHHVKKSEKL